MAKKKKVISLEKASVKKKQQAKVSPEKKGKQKDKAKKEMKKKETPKAEAKKLASSKAIVNKSKQEKEAPVQTAMQQNPTNQPTPAGTGKKRLMMSYEKLPEDVVEVIRTKYPYGYNHDLKEVKGIDNKKFFVLPIDLPEVVYLVKVDIRKPFKIQDAEDEEDMFTPEDDFGGEDDFPADDLEQIEGDDEGEEVVKKKKKKEDDDEED